jgi:hypothetical protein
VEEVHVDLDIEEEVGVGHILYHVIARVGTLWMVLHTVKDLKQVEDMYSD